MGVLGWDLGWIEGRVVGIEVEGGLMKVFCFITLIDEIELGKGMDNGFIIRLLLNFLEFKYS
jgi:hypothetical protein